MPTLKVSNGYTKDLPGLGTMQDFAALSGKRITRCTRETLRNRYGQEMVEVSCSALFDGSSWTGQCVIGGEPHKYLISTQ
jgi:hypothetical protein